jgi:hypothetical protein
LRIEICELPDPHEACDPDPALGRPRVPAAALEPVPWVLLLAIHIAGTGGTKSGRGGRLILDEVDLLDLPVIAVAVDIFRALGRTPLTGSRPALLVECERFVFCLAGIAVVFDKVVDVDMLEATFPTSSTPAVFPVPAGAMAKRIGLTGTFPTTFAGASFFKLFKNPKRAIIAGPSHQFVRLATHS